MEEKNPDQDKWERSPGYVYFIAAGDPMVAIKIGVTIQAGMKTRLRAHQTSNHEPLKILAVIPCEGMERPMLEAEKKEKELHTKFVHLQRFESGWVGSEWFTVSDELLKEISEIGTKPSDLGIEDSIAKIAPGINKT